MKRMVLPIMHWYILMVFLLFLPRTAFSVTRANSAGGSPAPGTSQHTVTAVKKVAVLIKQIKNNVLFTKNGENYDLTGVKMSDFSGIKEVRAYEGHLAELTFVDSVLKEITIRH